MIAIEEPSGSALQPAVICLPQSAHRNRERPFQGIPGIEVTAQGRLWATWYAGGTDEGARNYVLLVTSDDDGRTWSPPVAVIDPPGDVRAYDPVLWTDPTGNLWWFWCQNEALEGSPVFDARGGVFGACATNPDNPNLTWSAPTRVGNGVMMNKPLVRSDGAWLFPTAIWSHVFSEVTRSRFPELAQERYSNLMISRDVGRSFSLLGSADVPERTCDEHMVVERRDGSLWMLVRTLYGIGESISHDGGRTWSPGVPSGLPGPNSRFHLRRLHSGNLLLISHAGDRTVALDNGNGGTWSGRSNLTAWLSMDDGHTWPCQLLIDPRGNVSYPDAAQDAAGNIYIIYDRERYRCGEILLARITEEDIRQGQVVTEESFIARRVEA